MLRDRVTVRITPFAYIVLALSVIIIPIDWILAWVLAMLIHEMSHIIAVICCGGQVRNICISHQGTQIKADNLTLAQQIICVLLGPIGGALLVFLDRWTPKLALCGVIQSAYNMLPLSMLDGGQVIHAFLRLRLSDTSVNHICSRIDWITSAVLCGCCLYFAHVLSWEILVITACVVAMRRKRSKIPCKRVVKRVQ